MSDISEIDTISNGLQVCRILQNERMSELIAENHQLKARIKEIEKVEKNLKHIEKLRAVEFRAYELFNNYLIFPCEHCGVVICEKGMVFEKQILCVCNKMSKNPLRLPWIDKEGHYYSSQSTIHMDTLFDYLRNNDDYREVSWK